MNTTTGEFTLTATTDYQEFFVLGQKGIILIINTKNTNLPEFTGFIKGVVASSSIIKAYGPLYVTVKFSSDTSSTNIYAYSKSRFTLSN